MYCTSLSTGNWTCCKYRIVFYGSFHTHIWVHTVISHLLYTVQLYSSIVQLTVSEKPGILRYCIYFITCTGHAFAEYRKLKVLNEYKRLYKRYHKKAEEEGEVHVIRYFFMFKLCRVRIPCKWQLYVQVPVVLNHIIYTV